MIVKHPRCKHAASTNTKGQELIEILILAAITLFILSRLYIALGKDTGPPTGRSRTPAPAPPHRQPAKQAETASVHKFRASYEGPGEDGIKAIEEADSNFDVEQFRRGAREAYKMIISAYAEGDRKTLQQMVDDDVFEAWDNAITQREASGVDPYKLLRIRKLSIDDAELDGSTARIMIRYEAELGDGENTRTARDIWTFKHDVNSSDPNWLLDDVETAS